MFLFILHLNIQYTYATSSKGIKNIVVHFLNPGQNITQHLINNLD